MQHEERGPNPQFGSPGTEHRVQVLPHQVAEKCVGQDALELGADLDPHRSLAGIVDDEQAATARLSAHTELPHRGEGELLEGEAASIWSDDDADVDAGLALNPLEILVVLPLVTGRDEVDAVAQPSARTAERRPEHGEQHGVND